MCKTIDLVRRVDLRFTQLLIPTWWRVMRGTSETLKQIDTVEEGYFSEVEKYLEEKSITLEDFQKDLTEIVEKISDIFENINESEKLMKEGKLTEAQHMQCCLEDSYDAERTILDNKDFVTKYDGLIYI